jgi:hypothetical protein
VLQLLADRYPRHEVRMPGESDGSRTGCATRRDGRTIQSKAERQVDAVTIVHKNGGVRTRSQLVRSARLRLSAMVSEKAHTLLAAVIVPLGFFVSMVRQDGSLPTGPSRSSIWELLFLQRRS